MSKSGQSNYRGVNSQAKAAILLFLINFYEGDFDSLTLEDDAWEDFTLSFQSGKKIIAEAKAWQRSLKLNDVVGILEGIAPKYENLSQGDEILIVCNSIDSNVPRGIEYLRYGLPISEIPGFKNYRKPEKLTPTILKLLDRTKFYKLPSNEKQSSDDFLFNETVARLYRILPMWLPQHEVEKLMTHILKEKIYDKSERGDTLTKAEFIQYLDDYKRTKISEAGAYDSEKQKVTKQVERMIAATNDEDEHYLLEGSNLISLSAQPMMMYIALDLIAGRKNLQLSEWDSIWRALINRSYTFRVVGIFEDNLSNLDNARYVLNFLEGSLAELTSISIEKHSRDHALTLVSKAINLHPELAIEALSFMQKYLKVRANSYKKVLTRRDLSYEKENVSKILTEAYSIGAKQPDTHLQQDVIDIISTYFDLAEDDGEYLNVSPSEVYELVYRWLTEDFYNRLGRVIEFIVDDFNESKFYKRGFDGWELMGGMESGWSNHYTIHDRGFVGRILTPAFKDVYEADRNVFWRYLCDNLITVKQSEVSREKPDFISRAAIPVIIEEYLHGTNSSEALTVLKKFLKLQKGLPDRGRLIFQALRGRDETADGKLWKITESYLSMSKTALPQSVFVEDVVLQLAVNGNQDALDCVSGWMDNPTYIDTGNRWHFYADAVIGKLLDSRNPAAQKTGIDCLRKYLTPAGKWEDGDNTRAWDITPLLEKALRIDNEDLASLIHSLYSDQTTLTKNRQLVITSLFAQPELKKSEEVSFLYKSVVEPIIFGQLKGDIQLIEKKFSYHHSRQNFVQFAEKLLEIDKFKEGAALLRIFINDTDPPLTNYPDDPEGTFNYHQKIAEGKEEIVVTTVRGWVPVALRRLVNAKSAEYITEVLDMTEQLLNDRNYYVRFQTLILLSDLARNRHTVLPTDRDVRFMSLDNAMRIESLAFAFLENKENRKLKPLMERVLYCFNFLRSLNENNAKRLIASAKELKFSEDLEHLSGLYLFFAEFRKKSFKEKDLIKLFGQKLYDDLNKYDDSFFKQFLEQEVQNGGSEMRRHLAWQFWRLIGDDKNRSDYEEMFNISHKYLLLMTSKYDHSAYEMLFHFIDDNIERKPTECIELWKAAIIAERDYLVANEKDITYHHNWWDRMSTADILLKIRQEQGDEEFLTSVETMLSYPIKLQGIHNPQTLYAALKSMNSERSIKTTSKFEESYPHVYAQERINGS